MRVVLPRLVCHATVCEIELRAPERPQSKRPLRGDVHRAPEHEVGVRDVERHHQEYREQDGCLYIGPARYSARRIYTAAVDGVAAQMLDAGLTPGIGSTP